jgi:hypothetical protein
MFSPGSLLTYVMVLHPLREPAGLRPDRFAPSAEMRNFNASPRWRRIMFEFSMDWHRASAP